MKRTVIAVVVAVALTATVTAAAATSSNTVKACSNIKTRVLALRSGPSCPSGTRAIDWSITGPQGRQGIQGKPGIQGKQGPPGTGLAWAWVLSDGHVEASTPNVTSVTKNVGGVQGVYCVNLSITNANVATVSISDVAGTGSVTGTPGLLATAEIVGLYDASAGCSHGIAVQTLATYPGSVSSGNSPISGSVTGLDLSFYLIVD
jgi:hypothetical protein